MFISRPSAWLFPPSAPTIPARLQPLPPPPLQAGALSPAPASRAQEGPRQGLGGPRPGPGPGPKLAGKRWAGGQRRVPPRPGDGPRVSGSPRRPQARSGGAGRRKRKRGSGGAGWSCAGAASRLQAAAGSCIPGASRPPRPAGLVCTGRAGARPRSAGCPAALTSAAPAMLPLPWPLLLCDLALLALLGWGAPGLAPPGMPAAWLEAALRLLGLGGAWRLLGPGPPRPAPLAALCLGPVLYATLRGCVAGAPPASLARGPWGWLLLVYGAAGLAQLTWGALGRGAGTPSAEETERRWQSWALLRRLMGLSQPDLPYLSGAFVFLTVAVIGELASQEALCPQGGAKGASFAR